MLMKPNLQAVLRESGFSPSEKVEKGSLSEQLDEAGLSLNQALGELAFLVRNTQNDSLKKSALETVLRLHGALKEQAAPLPTVTIVIKDPTGSLSADKDGVNPIVLPRELLGGGRVN